MQLREELSLCRIYKRSKCARSFDRRPPPIEEAAVHDEAAVNHHHHHHQDGSADVAVDTTINNEQNPGVESGLINWDMETLETEPLWDSEFFMLLNYFDF